MAGGNDKVKKWLIRRAAAAARGICAAVSHL